MRLRWGAAVALGAAIVIVACSVGSVDFSNKGCPCGSGYVCDTARDLCVLPGQLGPGSEGGVTPTPDSGSPSEAGPDCHGDACPCGVDADCKDHVFPHCSPNKICVGCNTQTDCGSGTYCNAQSECVLGCKDDTDCQISPASPHCDVNRHQCVQCRTISDCSGADRCSPSGQCVQGCNLDAGQLCGPGKTCCSGLCIDTTKDLFNCGGCGIACSTANATPACAGSVCSWTCAAGFDHCSTTNSGCETNLRTNATHCGSCTTDCTSLVANASGTFCNAAVCDYAACTANHDNCDGDRTNGCECSCGTKHQERCCPSPDGGTCNAGLTCNGGSNKCN